MPRESQSLKICLIAGEASGDALGASLMGALRTQYGADIVFCGVGGDAMERNGMQSLFPMRDLSVMGLAEVLPRLPTILKRIRQTAGFVEAEAPDVLITIDSPDFCFRVAAKVRESMAEPPKMIHYVAPTVWAWRPERAKKVAALYDGIMCLFPCEPEYFSLEGMDAVFVGHPVLEACRQGNGSALREELGIAPDAQVLGLLFGSRMGEMNRVGPVLHDAAELLQQQNPELHILSLTFPHLHPVVKNLMQGLGKKVHIVTDQTRKWDCFAAMNGALATSGTVGLELAVAGIPHAIAYKMHPFTAQIVKRKVRVSHAHLANILLEQSLVPEFIQGDCKALPIAARMAALNAAEQQKGFGNVRKLLAGAGGDEPAAQAARFVLAHIEKPAAGNVVPARAAG